MISTHILPKDAKNLLDVVRFHAICNLIKSKDKSLLDQFINRGGDLNTLIEINGEFTKPVNFLAQIGDDEAPNDFADQADHWQYEGVDPPRQAIRHRPVALRQRRMDG